MKVQTYVETCQPGESPRFGFAKPPPFGKGALGGDFLLFQELYQLDDYRGGKGQACHLGKVPETEGRGHHKQGVKARDKQHGKEQHHAGEEGVEGVGVGGQAQAEDGGASPELKPWNSRARVNVAKAMVEARAASPLA